MEKKVLNIIKRLKRQRLKMEVSNASSVSAGQHIWINKENSNSTANDLFQELKDALSLGEEISWRMWR
jgi:hypothetical protein